MKYQGFLVRRYLRTRILPYFAVATVALGVFVLIAVLSVMEGFKHEMRDRIRGSLSHLTVTGEVQMGLFGEVEVQKAILALEHVKAVAPYVKGMGLHRSRVLDTCVFWGIDPAAEAHVGSFATYVLRESEWRTLLSDDSASLPDDREPLSEEELSHFFSLEWRHKIYALNADLGGGPPVGFDELPPQPILVGLEALRHGTIDMGQTIKITSYSPVDKEPKWQDFLVVGTFRTGVFEQDMGWVYMPIRAAQEYLDLYDDTLNDYLFSGVSVSLDDYRHAEKVEAVIEDGLSASLPGRHLRARSWEDQRRTLLTAVDIEKKIIFVMMLLIVLFAGFVIFLILAQLGVEKTRDIGVMMSLGATPNSVVSMFLRMGFTLTIAGILVGGSVGWLFTSYINAIHDTITALTGMRLFPPDIYYLTEIPVQRSPRDLAIVMGAALSFGFLGSLIPAWLAARKDPVRTLRYE